VLLADDTGKLPAAGLSRGSWPVAHAQMYP
jgi:hypothetical protein